jgi:CBS domain-containing protein
MQKYRISSLVVCRDGVPGGMVTDRDMRNKVVAQGLDIRNLTIGEIMNSPLITILNDEFLIEALQRISRYGMNRLAVIDGAGALVGIITASDILRIQDSRPQNLILNIEEAIDVNTLNEIHQRVQGLIVHLVGSGVRI